MNIHNSIFKFPLQIKITNKKSLNKKGRMAVQKVTANGTYRVRRNVAEKHQGTIKNRVSLNAGNQEVNRIQQDESYLKKHSETFSP